MERARYLVLGAAMLLLAGVLPSRALGLEILEWARYGDPDEETANAEAAILSLVPAVTFTRTVTDEAAEIAALLPGKDVFFVPELDFAGYSGEGTTFAPVLEPFVAAGGVLVCCAEGFPRDQGTFLKDTGLLDRDYVDWTRVGTATLLSPGHPLAEGVGETIGLINVTAYYTTGDPGVEIVYAHTDNPDYGIVMYRPYGEGHVVGIGYDYYTRSADADRILANAVTLPEPAALSLLALGAVALLRRRRRG